MVGTKARWYAPTAPAKADPPVRGNPIYPGLIDGDKKRQGREKRRERRNREPQRKPGGAPSYKPYDYPSPNRKPKPTPGGASVPEAPARSPVRRLPRLPLGPALGVIGAAEVIGDILFRNPDPAVKPALPPNYYWCNGPRMPWPVMSGHRFYIYESDPFFTHTGNCTIPPIAGQSVLGGWPLGMSEALASNPTRCYWARLYSLSGAGSVRTMMTGTIQRQWVMSPQPMAHPPIVRMGFHDPNIERWAPPRLAPRELTIGHGTPLAPSVTPEAFANPQLPYSPDFGWQYDIALDAPIPPVLDGPEPPPARPPRLPPVQRQPPRRREKQRKVITKTKAIALALYKALDAASESAEVVDALYQALPDDVKKRWHRDDRMGDNFGQYGLGGADWKLQALYHNWHRLDVVQAIKNIIKNELQDRIIGGMQAGLPVNTGAAHSQGEKRLAKLLDEWFAEELGL